MIFDKATALQLCALNEAAYDLATTGHCKLPDGFAAPQAIRMPPGDRPFFLRGDPLDIWGYVSASGGKTYVVFRGTQFTSGLELGQEWCEDAASLPLKPLGPGNVHLGFYGAWEALRAATIALAGTGQRIITGHSLGAAIATLCWADIGGDLMTFASPRVGDPDFAAALWKGQTVRIINEPDIVPDVPTDPPFRHGGFEQKVHGPGSVFDRVLAHALPSYATGLSAL